MPTYTYFCADCSEPFELFSTISNYKEKQKCPKCNIICSRCYEEDMLTLNSSVRKSDSELKTLGDLADRNRDRLSNDQKTEMHQKQNEYKDQDLVKQLPKGMSRMKKTSGKFQWPK